VVAQVLGSVEGPGLCQGSWAFALQNAMSDERMCALPPLFEHRAQHRELKNSSSQLCARHVAIIKENGGVGY
jgi:hypothetical protein